MGKNASVFLATLFALSLVAPAAFAQSAAPEMFGVGEIVLDYVRFDDAKASDNCSLSREQVTATLGKALTGTNVPVIAVQDARPPMMGVARIELIPTISTHVDENLNCISWVSLSAESHSNVMIAPVNVLRSVTVLYWRQHTKLVTSQSMHQMKTDEVLQKMAAQFAQQYRVDQPPEIVK